MKLLIVTNNPSRASFRLRIEDHLDALRGEGIQCDVSALPKKVVERWRLFKASAGYDAVLLDRKSVV